MKRPPLDRLPLAGACALAILASATRAPLARAQGDDTAAALALFEEGRKLAEAGDLGAACPKFLASYNQVQKLGTLLNLADCYEKQGKTASAWARFTEAATMAERAGQKERVDFARQHAEALAPKLSKLTITVASPPPGIEVKRDGATVDAAAFGSAVPVDPGKHEIQARAPGKRAWSETVEVGADGARASVQVPALGDAPAAAPAASTGAAPAASAQGADGATPWGTQRTIGAIAGGAGVVAIGLGLFVGSRAQAEYDKSNERGSCVGDECFPEGVQAREDAKSLAGVSTGVVIGGAALLAGGAALFFTAPKGPRKTSVRVGPGSIVIGRSW